MRSDIIKMYKDVHTWTGIVSGLFLFIAFYAGAITMFKGPLQEWSSPPPSLGEVTSLDRSPELVERVLAEYPDARGGYEIILDNSARYPARMTWELPSPDAHDHDLPEFMHANLAADGSLVVGSSGVSPVGQLVDDLHRQVGLLLPHGIAMPIMGVVALLYGVALVSGVIVLLPTLVSDLFAFRLGKNLKRMWLDFHNLLGIFSLPFHLIMALTSVVFAFHDQIYGAQELLVFNGNNAFIERQRGVPSEVADAQERLAPAAIVARLKEQQPDFVPRRMIYNGAGQPGPALVVFGDNPRYGMRSPDGGVVGLDPYSGEILMTDYMPGMQSAVGASITSFFTLHFGSYGGSPVRWTYFLLGLGGAVLFYTGNLLWLETRRKKLKKSLPGKVEQSRASKLLGALTVGVTLGCVAGISASIASAKLIPGLESLSDHGHEFIYYLVFFTSLLWAFLRGVARAAVELLYAAAVACALLPTASLLSLAIPGWGWNHPGYTLVVDLVAMAGAALLVLAARRTARRIHRAPIDSIWYSATCAAILPGPASASVPLHGNRA